AAAAGSAPASPAAPSGARGRPDHVVVVVFENKAYSQVAGSGGAPYLNQLAAGGLLFERFAAVAHPSEPNYLALFSGSTQGLRSDKCPLSFPGVPTLASQLAAAGLSFVGYAEGLPRAGDTTCSAGRYARKHAPWFDFPGAPAGQPYSAFPKDFAKLPTVSFVIPDLCHDMHDCSVRTGDDWARANLEPYRAWAQTHNSLLVVTLDEDDNQPGNHIFTAITGAGVRPGRFTEPVDHYRLLRTIESWYGLPGLGLAAQRAPVPGVWP
ncbi:MAG: acid phosphatase, partial [Micromonosporaceae bacterium]|nr:acid phosphatase [Micromonosporaceae bacterium]